MIKVVHIITKLELGGAQQNTLYTVSHLNKSRFVPVLITGSEGILVDDAKRLGIEAYFLPSLVREINPLKDISALFTLVMLLRRIKKASLSPTIVHTHSSKAGIIGRWAAFLAGISYIIHTYHGFGFNDYQSSLKRLLYIYLEWITSSITTRFIAVSQNNIAKGISLNLFKREEVLLIRSGIDIDEFKNVIVDKKKKKEELDIDPELPLIGMIACFKPQKSPLDFVKAAYLVHEISPDVRFIIAGDGELRSAMEELISRLGMNHIFRLLGFRRDIPEIMKCLDLLVLTSLWEGLPRVILQGMASGLPVVATCVDGSSEVVRDGINGYLVKPGDIGDIADKIIHILEMPKEQIEKMKSAGAGFLKEFDINLMVSQQEELYEELVR